MANWRPEDWQNPHLYYGSPHTMIDVESNKNRLAFEAGADAMLEALKKQGINHRVYADHLRFGFGRGAKVLEGKEETVTYQGVKGTLVFIPDND